MSISWQARVARNTSALLMMLIATTWVDAQSLHSKKISFCCNSSDFETIIEDLSKATGAYFVYSSNKIPTSRHITLSLKNRPLSEVLDELSKQLNVSFKIQAHYVTVKPNEVQYLAAANELLSLNKTFVPRQFKSPDPSTENVERPLGRFVVEKMASATELPSSDGDITPYLVKLKPYFDPTFLKKVPILYLKSATKKLRVGQGWFVSAGSVVNDYSGGLEIQAGLRQAYIVFSPTWLRDDQYHGALGIGSSLQLSNVLALQPVYSYASMKETRMDHVNSMFAKSPSYQTNISTSHHQFKLMLQYDVSKKIKFRAGPTFNQSSSTSSHQLLETMMGYRTGGQQYYPPDGPGYGQHIIIHDNTAQQPAAPATVTSKFWLGWEASLSYRINFK